MSDLTATLNSSDQGLEKINLCILKSKFANLYSVENALSALGVKACITDDPRLIKDSDAVIFPGVGSFAQVKQDLDKHSLTIRLKRFAESGKPMLGICLGMQLLFQRGYEGEQPSEGLGLLEGEVIQLDKSKVARVPHIGWNTLECSPKQEFHDIFNGQPANPQVYFVHSFYCSASNTSQIAATTEVGLGYKVPVMVKKNNIYGMQFHPERSGKVGLLFLKNFIQIVQKHSQKA